MSSACCSSGFRALGTSVSAIAVYSYFILRQYNLCLAPRLPLNRHDTQTQNRRVPLIFAKERRAIGQTQEPGDIQIARGGGKARARRPIFQARRVERSERA